MAKPIRIDQNQKTDEEIRLANLLSFLTSRGKSVKGVESQLAALQRAKDTQA